VDHNAVKSKLFGVGAVTDHLYTGCFRCEQGVINDMRGATPVADYDGCNSGEDGGIDRHELKGDSTRHPTMIPKCKCHEDYDIARRNPGHIRARIHRESRTQCSLPPPAGYDGQVCRVVRLSSTF